MDTYIVDWEFGEDFIRVVYDVGSEDLEVIMIVGILMGISDTSMLDLDVGS